MIKVQRILCPADFSDSSIRALAHAEALARWYEAQLTVLHVVPTFEPIQVQAELGVPVQIVNPMPREEVVRQMRPFLERAGVSSEAQLIAEARDPRTTIVDQALTTRADLIV